jgi:transcriptional regulator with XRE-family HTH domain
MDIVPTFGRRLREERERCGLSQAELSRRTGIAQSILSQIERGLTRDPGVSRAKVLEEALGVEPYGLLRPAGKRRRRSLEKAAS